MEFHHESYLVLLKKRDLHLKKTFGYKQRNEEKRHEFVEKIALIDASKIIYLDESGIRKNEAIEYGWAKKGRRLHDLRDGSTNKCLNIIGSLKQGKIIAPFAFEGSCNTDVFNTYLQKILKPILKENDVIILDNASFHRSSNIYEIAREAGCRVEFLPPYSPDLNKIEGYWYSVKTKFRKSIKNSSKSPMDAITDIFMSVNLEG